ncbi:L-dopachrome tautomerase-related protein [Micromonospora avicenniae]|uniref:Sugar lactone lactonase YvrE n=1 Tax=Micromonospora avicenniae TaxID=1198245 RepID=A0A1N7E1Q2_9ACTN|nr:L-dopachrome tautomerase-related protein [Micromonospora avicenniae]SIR81971.1 Sugar lactone lactonase YvrE [Micromonospora avicenniae]
MNGPVGDEPVGELELVHTFTGPMPTGVTVSHTGRIFVNYPQWGDDPPATVAELRDGREVPFPDERWNSPGGDDDAQAFVSVQSVVVDPADRLWVVDTGSPMFRPTKPGGPKLVRIDLDTDQVAQVITFPPDVVLPSTYLNDVRFDLRRGPAGLAYLTDSASNGPNGIVVVDLATGRSWRRLHDHPSTKAESLHGYRPMVEGRPLLQRPPDGPPTPLSMGSDGIAISADGSRLYYCPLASRHWYSVSTDALADASLPDEEMSDAVVDEGDKGTGSDGLESDDAGRIYFTSYEHNAVYRRLPDGQFETLLHDPRLLWPDTMSVATDGHLYVTANQLHRQATYQGGQDRRRKPYALFRTPIDAGPVLLR